MPACCRSGRPRTSLTLAREVEAMLRSARTRRVPARALRRRAARVATTTSQATTGCASIVNALHAAALLHAGRHDGIPREARRTRTRRAASRRGSRIRTGRPPRRSSSAGTGRRSICCSRPNVLMLDSGCLWGGALTAIRLPDRRVYQVPSRSTVTPAPTRMICFGLARELAPMLARAPATAVPATMSTTSAAAPQTRQNEPMNVTSSTYAGTVERCPVRRPIADRNGLHGTGRIDDRLQQRALERQQRRAVARRCLRERPRRCRRRVQRLRDLLVDAMRVVPARALDEQRADAGDEPSEHRPARDLRLGDEAHRTDRVQREDVEPRHVIRDDDRRSDGRACPSSGCRCPSDAAGAATSCACARGARAHRAMETRTQIVQSPRTRCTSIRGTRHSRRNGGVSRAASMRQRLAELRGLAMSVRRVRLQAAATTVARRTHRDSADAIVSRSSAWFCPPRLAILIEPITDARLPRRLPIPALRNAVQQAGAIRVAATGGIDDRRRPHGRNRIGRAVGMNDRSLRRPSSRRARRHDRRCRRSTSRCAPTAGVAS